MSGFRRLDLPADIPVFAGDFDSQPAAFAHLLTVAPSLDLTHVEVIQGDPIRRLATRFDALTVTEIGTAATGRNTLVLILPAAHDTLDCPVPDTPDLSALGIWRGHIPHLIHERPAE